MIELDKLKRVQSCNAGRAKLALQQDEPTKTAQEEPFSYLT